MGAPLILQSDNGPEFVAKIIHELKTMYNGSSERPRHPQSQGSVERANGDVKNMLSLWLKDNNTKDWPLGIRIVQQQKNNSYHSTIKCNPYIIRAVYGMDMNYCLSSTNIPKQLLENISDENEQ